MVYGSNAVSNDVSCQVLFMCGSYYGKTLFNDKYCERIMPCLGNIVKNKNINPHKIVNFHEFAKFYTRKNTFIHSNHASVKIC